MEDGGGHAGTNAQQEGTSVSLSLRSYVTHSFSKSLVMSEKIIFSDINRVCLC